MANIADGTLEIYPLTLEEMEIVRNELQSYEKAFSYGGESGFNISGSTLYLTFSGRWTCTDAWDVLDKTMADSLSESATIYIKANIHGKGFEPGLKYRSKVTKSSGASKLTRE